MKINSNQETQEFIAKIYCDLGKNIITIGVASYFFKDLPLPIRIVMSILGIGFIFVSIYTFSKKGDQ